MTADPDDNPLGHAGEIEMRALLPSRYHWTESGLRSMMRAEISPALARFIESLPFFFIATASAAGHCDASFRGREYDASGNPLPSVRVVAARELVFPDYPGNGLYTSLGNIRSNPHIGMLFIDFESRRRARINGRAEIRPPDLDRRKLWPLAEALVHVTVEQAFGNCAARVPRMTMVPGSDWYRE